jgi:lysophospholipase L1-like esterase
MGPTDAGGGGGGDGGETPFASFAPAIAKLNAALPAAVSELQQRYGEERLMLADCNHVLLLPGGEGVDPLLMPDLLHPNAQGMGRWAECMAAYALLLARDQIS